MLQKGLPQCLPSQRICLQCRRDRRLRFESWFGKIPWRRKWQPIPIFLTKKFLEQRSLTSYSFYGVTVRQDWRRMNRWCHWNWTLWNRNLQRAFSPEYSLKEFWGSIDPFAHFNLTLKTFKL